MQPITDSLPYCTTDLPGTGGHIKSRPEDFIVEELPLYEPSGEGEHLMLFIEKRRQTTTDVIRRMAKLFKVRRNVIGYAGMKDKHAITRQCFTVQLPGRESDDEELISRIQYTPFDLIWSKRHNNKIKRGHLRGNRFTIYMRDVDESKAATAEPILKYLETNGMPNFLGEQRFGYRQNNHIAGRFLLLGQWQEVIDTMLGGIAPDDNEWFRTGRGAYERGDYAAALQIWPKQLRHERSVLDGLRQGQNAEKAVMRMDEHQRRFMVSSIQGYMFNRVLERRMNDATYNRLLEGDLAWKHTNRSVFDVDAETAEIENAPDGRIASLEVSPSGPMWGARMTRARGVPGQIENEALAEQDLTLDDLATCKHEGGEGKRRALRERLTNVAVETGDDDAGPFIKVTFELPRGCFATMAMREIMKPGSHD